MVPVSNSTNLSSRTFGANGRSGGVGQAAMSPLVAASEPLNYAHIGATGFFSNRGSNNAPITPAKTDTYGQSTRQDRFQEILERQAATAMKQLAPEPQNNSDFGGAAGWGAMSQSNPLEPATTKKEMKWLISMSGNQVAFSVNPNAR